MALRKFAGTLRGNESSALPILRDRLLARLLKDGRRNFASSVYSEQTKQSFSLCVFLRSNMSQGGIKDLEDKCRAILKRIYDAKNAITKMAEELEYQLSGNIAILKENNNKVRGNIIALEQKLCQLTKDNR